MKSKLKGRVGLIGLGRIGEGIAKRLRQGAYGIIACDPRKNKNGVPLGIDLVESLPQLVHRIRSPRLILVSVPHDSVDLVLDNLVCLLTVGDTVADMGNSHYRDSIERHRRVNAQGINFLDVGTSGGILGAEQGFCLMIGGDEGVAQRNADVFKCLGGSDEAWKWVGGPGAGSFVKMIHNAIEYASIHALSDGFDLLERAGDLGIESVNVEKVAKLWTHGSIAESRLLSLAAELLEEDPELSLFTGGIGGGETGRWAIQTAQQIGLDLRTVRVALEHRATSAPISSLGRRLASALRFRFGGHGYGKRSLPTDPEAPILKAPTEVTSRQI